MILRQFQETLGGHCGLIQTSLFLQAILLSPVSVVFDIRFETTAPEQKEYKRSKYEVLIMETILGTQAICTAPIQYTQQRG